MKARVILLGSAFFALVAAASAQETANPTITTNSIDRAQASQAADASFRVERTFMQRVF